jgi:hypothetical protein
MRGWSLRRQVIVASAPLGLADAESESLGAWWVHAGGEARVARGARTWLVGLAADIDAAAPADVAALDRAAAAGGPMAVAAHADRWAGRFLILVADGDDLAVVPDGWGSLQAFWGAEPGRPIALSTSPGLLMDLGLVPEGGGLGSAFTESQRARALEYRSFGDRCPVSGANRMLPNHVLHLRTGRSEPMAMTPRRRPFAAITQNLGRAMTGLAAAHGGPVRLPITAGLDSRWLALAASRARLEVELFTFTAPGVTESVDATVGAIVASRLGFRHRAVPLPSEVDPDVRDEVRRVRGMWRDLPKMAEIGHYSGSERRPLVLNGNGGEILRGSKYGTGPRLGAHRLVRSLCLGRQPAGHEIDGFEQWYQRRAPLAAEGVELYDLYYWEQRMANWGSDFYAEKENVVDELSPFCCRRTLLAGPAVGGRETTIHLDQHLRAEPSLADVPLNPGAGSSALKRLAVPRQIGNLLFDTAMAARRLPAGR